MTEEEVELIYNYLHENYEYRDGELIAKTTSGRRLKGKEVGSSGKFESSGKPSIYIFLSIDMVQYKLLKQKMIYLFHYKKLAAKITFKDNNPFNCDIDNLLEASTNKLGFKGIYKNKSRFTAEIHRNGITRNLGTYNTPEEAHAAYLKAKEEYK